MLGVLVLCPHRAIGDTYCIYRWPRKRISLQCTYVCVCVCLQFSLHLQYVFTDYVDKLFNIYSSWKHSVDTIGQRSWDELLSTFGGLKNSEQHSSYLAGRPGGVINNDTLKLMFWAAAGWRCTGLFWAALAYVKVGGGEVYARCRSQAWEITSSTRHRWNVRPERKKRRRFLNHQPTALTLLSRKSFLL